MNTIKIKSTHESQGPFVIINEEDFDAKRHVLYVEDDSDEKKEPKKLSDAESKAEPDGKSTKQQKKSA